MSTHSNRIIMKKMKNEHSVESDTEYNTEKCELQIPIDQGWAWMVMIGFTCSNIIYMGTVRSFGLFFVEYLELFSASVSITSLVSALQLITQSLSTLPVLTTGLKFLSVRQSVMIGAFLCSLSYMLNSFATSIAYVVVVQGLLFGIGAAWVYPTGMVILGEYFDKRRGFANGVAMAGVSVGALVLPPIYSHILSQYGLYGGMTVTSGIMLNLFVVSAVYRPPTFYKRKKEKNMKTMASESKDRENYCSPLQTNDRLSSSQPLLQTETFPVSSLDRVGKSRSMSTNIDNDVDIISESVADELSHSGFIKYQGNSAMDLQSPDSRGTHSASEKSKTSTTLCDTISKLFPLDVSLFKHLPFMLNTIGFCFGCQVIGVGSVYIVPFAVEKRIEVKNAAILLSVVGGADLVSRLIGGYLADRKWIKTQYMVAISQGFVCVVMNMVRFCENFWTFVIFSVMTGFFGGIAIAVNPTLIMYTTGNDRFKSGVAIYNLATGISIAVTTPLSGFLRDYTGSYYMTFHYIGAASFISMIVYTAMGLTNKND